MGKNKVKSEKDIQKSISIMICIISVIFALSLLAAFVHLLMGYKAVKEIKETVKSPNKEYQVGVVIESKDASDRGESYLIVESADKKGGFTKKGKAPTGSFIRVKEAESGFTQDYDIEWTSDSSFSRSLILS